MAETFREMGSKSFAPYQGETIVFSHLSNRRITVLARPAHNEPKEVAQMNSTKLWTTAHNPSDFGMPMSGHAFGVVTPVTDACRVAATSVVRERMADIAGTTGAVKAGLGLTQSYFPGNSAWRPPNC
jgi:hypothetical protein